MAESRLPNTSRRSVHACSRSRSFCIQCARCSQLTLLCCVFAVIRASYTVFLLRPASAACAICCLVCFSVPCAGSSMRDVSRFSGTGRRKLTGSYERRCHTANYARMGCNLSFFNSLQLVKTNYVHNYRHETLENPETFIHIQSGPSSKTYAFRTRLTSSVSFKQLGIH